MLHSTEFRNDKVDTIRLLAALPLFLALLGAAACGEVGADCGGTNGNAAVAACHPDVEEIQEACPDNSNGQEFATPTEECLEAVRIYSGGGAGASDGYGFVEPPLMTPAEEKCQKETEEAIDIANRMGPPHDATPYMSQKCLNMGF